MSSMEDKTHPNSDTVLIAVDGSEYSDYAIECKLVNYDFRK